MFFPWYGVGRSSLGQFVFPRELSSIIFILVTFNSVEEGSLETSLLESALKNCLNAARTLHVLDLAGFPSLPVRIGYYCSFCSVLVLLGQFVFNQWKGLFSVPFLYPIPVVVVVSSTGVKY